MNKFSIIIPVYKTEEYIDNCIQSVIGQSFADYEIILVDDGSPDRCPEICDTWALSDKRIKVVHQDNGGLSKARNTGIKSSSGDYVLFLDSDDWWADENVLSAIANQLEKTPVDVLSFNYNKAFKDEKKYQYFSKEITNSDHGETLSEIMRDGRWITGACNKALKRSNIIENNLFFRIGITSEDIDWTLRVALCSESFAFLNVSVFNYRQHSSSISHSTTIKKVECLRDNIVECIDILNKSNTESQKLMMPFIAYQYGVLLFNVAALPEGDVTHTLKDAIKSMSYLLAYSKNAKVRALYFADRFIGISFTVKLLRIRQKILRRIGKEI